MSCFIIKTMWILALNSLYKFNITSFKYYMWPHIAYALTELDTHVCCGGILIHSVDDSIIDL
jgi:hypothetical protein